MSNPTTPRIFVNIASYRDPECQATVDNIFARAEHPERVFVGICLQIDAQAEPQTRVKAHPQVRIYELPYQESHGANWARAKAQDLWSGEDYVLQIDSHMRFEKGWDETLITMLATCPTPKAVLSTYVPRYTPPDNITQYPGEILRIRAQMFGQPGSPQLLHLTRVQVPLADSQRSGLYRSPFIIANFLFMHASTVHEIPFDPYIQFWGDEISYAARLWTHGYDIYQPDRTVAYHYWRRDEYVSLQPYRNPNTPRAGLVYERIRHLLGQQESANPEATRELEKYGLGTLRPLSQLWEFAGVNWQSRTLSDAAQHGIWNIPGEYKTLRSPQMPGRANANATIFVNIASYRDPECQWTVKDLFDKATYPERVFVGICWQFDEKEDQDCFQVSTRPEQVRVMPVDWRESEGVSWARHHVQQLWEGEDYTLQIDSHMRFVPGWDELMIAELAACPSEKPVLSCSPAHYTPPDQLSQHTHPSFRHVMPFTPEGNIRGRGESLDVVPETPLNGAFIAAGFVFSKSNIIAEVPYDPYLYFDQEEIMYAARIYTHGWDVFSARRQFLYHYYNTAQAPGGSVRKLHWRDLQKENGEKIQKLRARGLARFNHFTGFEPSTNEEIIADAALYGFGKARSLQEFEAYTGIDFKRKQASEKALFAQFIRGLDQYLQHPIRLPQMNPHMGQPGRPPMGMPNMGQPNMGMGRPPMTPPGGMPPGYMPGQMPPGQAGGRPPHMMGQMPPHMNPNMMRPPQQGFAPMQPPQQPANGETFESLNPMEPQLSPSFALPLMETGDFIPLFRLPDSEGMMRSVDQTAGRFGFLLVLPFEAQYISALLVELSRKMSNEEKQNAPMSIVIHAEPEQVATLKQMLGMPHIFMADEHHGLAQVLGVCQPDDATILPVAFTLDPNLRVVSAHKNLEPSAMAKAMLADYRAALSTYAAANAAPRIISKQAPALIIPDAFTPEFVRKCLDAFENGETYEGKVGIQSQSQYKPDVKSRTDFIPLGELLSEIDEKLSRSVFPEIKKVFGFEVTHRELYKIGMYDSAKGGFFRAHRDNFDEPMFYRRVAMTLHLNDDYQGGGLRFPEYSEDIYRPDAGAAIIFSCANMHEAMPVLSGKRFVLVGFFYGEQDEAYRRQYNMRTNDKLRVEQHTPVLRRADAVETSRESYTAWARGQLPLMPMQGQGPRPPGAPGQQPGALIPPKAKQH